MRDQGDWKAADAGDRCGVTDEVEFEIVVQCCVDCRGCAAHAERIAIIWRANDRLGSNIVACTRPVFDDEGLAQAIRQPLAH